MDGLACYLHRPTVCGHQTRGQSFLSGTALSHHITLGSGTFPVGARPLVMRPSVQWIYKTLLQLIDKDLSLELAAES
jgi:hypothetical protein